MNHLGSLVMETEHLYLRPFVLEDAPAMYGLNPSGSVLALPYEIGPLILKI